ncbi:MAG: hypothetical protein V7K92_26060 [Nostoc sp.]|uniref:hypothetical protein n=1 Tax=Nostoc sp. TaxID=1180 RepID=UPI002FF1BB96
MTLDDSLTLRYRLWRLPFSQRERLRQCLERVRRSYVANAALSSVGNLRNALAPLRVFLRVFQKSNMSPIANT